MKTRGLCSLAGRLAGACLTGLWLLSGCAHTRHPAAAAGTRLRTDADYDALDMRMLAYAAGESIENLPLAQSISGKPVLMTMPIQAVTLHAADTKYLLTTLTSLLALNGKIQCLEAEQRDAALVRLGQRPAAALPDVRIEAGRQLNAHYILAGFLFELPQASASSASARRTAGVEAPTLYKLVLELTDVKTGLVAHQMAHYRSHHAGKAVFGR